MRETSPLWGVPKSLQRVRKSHMQFLLCVSKGFGLVALGDSWTTGVKYLALLVLGVAFIVFGNVEALVSLLGQNGGYMVLWILFGVGFGYGAIILVIVVQRDLGLGKRMEMLIYAVYFFGFISYWIWSLWQSFFARVLSIFIGGALIVIVMLKIIVSVRSRMRVR